MNKQLIDALKCRSYSKKELLEVLKEDFPSDSRDAMRKRLERHLSKLITLGLVEKRGNKYCWYIYLNFLDENYTVKLNHSRGLIPALRRISGEYGCYNDQEKTILGYAKNNDECVESHLLAYPEIFGIYQEFQKLRHKMEEEKKQFLTKLNERVKKAFREIKIADNYPRTSEIYVRKQISSLIYRLVISKSSPNLRVVGEHVFVGDIQVARGFHLFERIKEFLRRETEDESNISIITRIEKREKDSSIIQNKLRKKMLELISRVNSGEKLKSKCNNCPEVYNIPEK